MEDVLLHQERELRRCYLFETINRQGYHNIKYNFTIIYDISLIEENMEINIKKFLKFQHLNLITKYIYINYNTKLNNFKKRSLLNFF